MTAVVAELRTERLWRELRALYRRRPDLAERLCAAAEVEIDPMLESLPELATVDEVADALRVSERTIRGWINDGTLQAVRLPGTRKVLIPREGVIKALQPYQPPKDEPLARLVPANNWQCPDCGLHLAWWQGDEKPAHTADDCAGYRRAKGKA